MSVVGQEVKVLDDGAVRVVDVMGSDEAVVQAARVSYGKGTKTLREDRGLIRYLMQHRHTSPFEMCEIKLHVRVPMDHWRQWIRHRTANVNEYSTRYSEAIDSQQAATTWRKQAKSNKQGSAGAVDPKLGRELSLEEQELHEKTKAVYQRRLELGVAREQARKDLPLSTYTEAYWKVDLHNLFHFLRLRLDPHAQLEIRQYAEAIAGFVKQWVPLCYEAFEDYQLYGTVLSRYEAQALRSIITKAEENNWLNHLTARELKTLAVKAEALGLGAWFKDRI